MAGKSAPTAASRLPRLPRTLMMDDRNRLIDPATGTYPTEMTPREILKHCRFRDADRREGESDSWLGNRRLLKRKLKEAKQRGTYDSIKANGLQEPILIATYAWTDDRPAIHQGHHRLAALLDLNPDAPVPVEFGPDPLAMHDLFYD